MNTFFNCHFADIMLIYFKLAVKEAEQERRLVWGDAMGKREYKLTPNSNIQTIFAMTENIGGPLFPLFAKMIPPSDESF